MSPETALTSPLPETEQFKEEIEHVQYLTEGGVRYGVFLLNNNLREENVNPVVINLAHGEEASVGAGRFDLNAFAQTIKRPLIVIDMAGMGKSRWLTSAGCKNASFDSMAANHLGVLNQLGVNNFDLIGNSMGAIMAAKIAALAGDRVGSLVTFSSPGFESRPAGKMAILNGRRNWADFKKTLSDAPQEIKEEVAVASAHRKKIPHENQRQKIASIIKFGRLLTKLSLDSLPRDLAQSTKWTDFIGTDDAFSDWRIHAKAVEQRNQLNPGSSVIKIQEGETHVWQAYYRWEVAKLASEALAA